MAICRSPCRDLRIELRKRVRLVVFFIDSGVVSFIMKVRRHYDNRTADTFQVSRITSEPSVRRLTLKDNFLVVNSNNFRFVFTGTLQQLSTIVTPREFLALLPDDGCVGFFLPYLQQCSSRCASQSVGERLVTRTRQLTT